MLNKTNNQSGFTFIELIITAAGIVLLGYIGYFAVKAHDKSQAIVVVSPSVTPSPTPTWKTYTSASEKASFKYPSDWTITSGFGSNEPNVDSIAFTSPDGRIEVEWTAAYDGLGGACDRNIPVGATPGPADSSPCPSYVTVSNSPIVGAPGLYVDAGTRTDDNINYEPWIAVQDGSSELDQHTMGYDGYPARNPPYKGDTAGFATNLPYAKGPKMTQAAAKAWLNSPDATTAKQILASLSY